MRMDPVRFLSLIVLALAQPAPGVEEVAPRDLGNGKRLVVTIRDTPAPPVTLAQKDRDREWIKSQPAGGRVYHPSSYRTLEFAVATATRPAPQPAWSLST